MVLEFPWQSGWTVGSGFDVVRADVTGGQAISAEGLDLNRQRAAQVQASTEVISDQSSSAKATNGALRIAGKGLGFKASLAASFGLSTTASHNSVLIQRASTTRVEQVLVRSSQPLAARARAELDRGAAAFRAAYGTHFIAGYVTGGSFVGRLRYEFTTRTDCLSFAAEGALQVKRAVAHVDVDASVEHDETTTRSHSEVQGDCCIIGGSTDGWQNAAHVSTPADLARAEVDFLSSSDDDPVRVIALVFPWSYLDEVPAEVSAIGPPNPENDALAADASDQLLKLEYAWELLSSAGDYPMKDLPRECRARREQLSRALADYLTQSGNGLGAAKEALRVLVADTEALLTRLADAWTFEVEYIAQFHTANKTELDSLSQFKTNGRYPVLRWTQGSIRVEPGVSRCVASFEDHNRTVLKLWARVDFEHGCLRVGTYFGYSGQEKWALANDNRAEGSLSKWEFARSEPGAVTSGWTDNALSMRNDGYREQCFIRARILERAKPSPVPAPRQASESRTTAPG